MRCAKCNTENLADAGFCTECGAKLELTCPSCSLANPPGSKFCRKCGTALGPRPSTSDKQSIPAPIRVAETPASENIEGERKTVTALFADIKGSMELMEDQDPEEARAIVDPALKLMIDAVRRYDGYIVQSTGDGIFALFGAPAAYEDRPQRALYASLRLQNVVRAYSAKLVAEGGTPIEARVGINTGEVVVRTLTTADGHTEYTPIGHTANLASRMQTIAPTGSIAITEHTRRLVEGYFDLNPRGPTRVKGLSEPINVYEVTGLGPLRTRLQHAAGRGLTKFIGRQGEIDAMKHAAEQAKGGRGQILAVMAEAGVGKSRLFFEFAAGSQSGWMVLEAFSVSHGKASAYLPVIELLRNYFKIISADDERTRREKVTGRVLALERTLEDTLPYLFSLLGIVEGNDPLTQMDAELKRRRSLDAIKRIILRESLNQPLMVIFEDLHWIDDETQAFLNLLADSIGTARVLLLVNYRPEYSHRWNSKTYYTQLRLDPLGKESAEELLSVLVGNRSDLHSLKRLIIERTQGNPFFMEETVLVLFDEAALLRDSTGVTLTKSLGELKIPPTVQAILAARIDRLPTDEKDLLQALAVMGKEFTLPLVQEVVRKSEDEIGRMLNDLQLAEFIYEQPAPGEIGYVFKHALTQEVAYNSVLMERRKFLHERAGRGIELLYTAHLDDHLGALTDHYRKSDNASKAAHYLLLSADRALRSLDYKGAIANASAALELFSRLPNYSAAELPLQLIIGQSSIATVGYTAPEVEKAFGRAEVICRLIGNTKSTFAAMGGLWVFYLVRGEHRKAHEFALRLQEIAKAEGSGALLTDANFALGASLFWQGRFAEGLEGFQHAISSYSANQILTNVGVVDTVAFARVYAACCLLVLGYPKQALEMSQTALERATAVKSPYSMTMVRMVGYSVRFWQRDPTVHKEITNAIAFSADHGFAFVQALGTAFLNCALLELDATANVLTALNEVSQLFLERGTKMQAPIFLSFLALGQGKMGNAEKGLAVIESALVQTAQTEERYVEAESLRIKGELSLKKYPSDVKAAEACFRTAIEVARNQLARWWELRATTDLARLLVKLGRHEEAKTMLADIYGWFTEGFDTADLKDAKALLEELGA